MINYYWIRVFQYDRERDSYEKGILLDEFYLKGEELSKNDVKSTIKNKYVGDTADVIKFAKPTKKGGLYALVMESNKFFYDRFYLEIDTYCFHCHKHIKGKAANFPRISDDYFDTDLEDSKRTYYFCSYDCKNKLLKGMRYEGEFQEKEKLSNIYGYIYLLYNRIENKYYIGQTRYLPFFRWQEHIKSGLKGDITDITFSVLAEIKESTKQDNQGVLNNIEAWWIQKFIEEGYEVQNITIPKLSMDDYKKMFSEMISREHQLELKEEIK